MSTSELWGANLLTASWQGLIFVGLVWLTCMVFRKLPARLKAWLWWLASLKLVVGLLWAGIALPLLPTPEISPLAQLNNRLDLMAPNVSHYSHVQTASSTASGLAVSTDAAPTWPSLLLAAWGVGMLISVGVIVVQGIKINDLRRRSTSANEALPGRIARELGSKMGLHRRPSVLYSEEISAPMVTGVLRPAILLPADLESIVSEDELRLCLGHELAHIKRLDLPLALIPSLMQAIYFFFPPAWLIRREWETEREAACDEEALATTASSPAAYGQLLMKIVTADHRGGLSPALGATASYHTLKKRITNMSRFVPTQQRMKLAATLIAGFALLLAVPWQVTSRALAAPAPDEKSLITNGGFEDGVGSWDRSSLLGDASSVSIAVDTGTFHGGKASLRFQKSENSFNPIAQMRQDIPFDGHSRFIKVSLWAKAQDVHKFTLTVGNDRDFAVYVGDRVGANGSVTHDWQQYKSVVKIPAGSQSVPLILEMYGPGTVWVDDVTATFTDSGDFGETSDDAALADVKDVSNEDLQVGGDPMMRYFLVGAKSVEPEAGHKLLIVLPGGNGSKDFNPFIRRLWKNALPPGYMIAELIAPKWSDDQFSSIVWPTRKQKWASMKFATEDFIAKVIQEVGKKHKIDAAHVYTLSWSSGGPAAYAASLGLPAIKGSFVAMSVFHPAELPPLFNAKGQAYYIYHSPDDKLIPMSQPQLADSELKKAGAKTIVETYEGGHGWHGDMFSGIRKGVEWLEKNSG